MMNKPIFILGSCRSGTRLLYNLLAVHPDVCWFSTITDAFFSVPQLAIFHKALDVPFLGSYLKKKILRTTWSKHLLIDPLEGMHIYEDYCHIRDDRKTTERDVTEDMTHKFKYVIRTHMNMTGKSRFLSKMPPNIQRIRLINAMFPDAYFIHIIRDGRAVANSLHNASWWNGLLLWWLGLRPKDWDAKGRDPIELCALHWTNNVQEVFRNRQLLKRRYIEVRYESLVEDVRGTLSPILTFCGLRRDTKYIALLPHTLPNMNLKWRQDLSSKQQAILQRVLHKQLVNLGYKKA